MPDVRQPDRKNDCVAFASFFSSRAICAESA